MSVSREAGLQGQGVQDSESRELLLRIYSAALQSVNGRTVVRGYLRHRSFPRQVNLIAIGKAAVSMAWGARDALGRKIGRALVITKRGYADPHLPFECLQSAHPLPDESSLEAGGRLLEFIASAPPKSPFLFLISGGTSSLVESLPEGVDLETLRRTNDWLLGSGLEIGAMNAIRKCLSRIKGGRLVRYLAGHPVLNLMISDVTDNDPAVIGSGLLVQGAEEEIPASQHLPQWLREVLQGLESSPVPAASCSEGVENKIVADCRMAMRAAAEEGRKAGLEVHLHPSLFRGDAIRLARDFVQEIRRGMPGLYVWGGESTVVLPSSPGRGGRNQSLALAAARHLEGYDSVLFLAAGSDGTDGPTREAGAVVDGGTIARGRLHGMNAKEALRGADAGRFLEASGDLISTGPTGTNVMDLVLGLKKQSFRPIA